MKNLIVVPPEFGVLFLVPVIGSFFLFKRTDDFGCTAFFYLITQIGLAALAHYIYG